MMLTSPQVFVFSLFLLLACGQRVTSITPKSGGVLGGTRLTVVGSGFDIRGRSNDVYIGTTSSGVFCDPIPNECTDSRIVCVTPPFQGRGPFPLSVRSNGFLASCGITSASGCSFSYTYDSTPLVDGIEPQFITSPSIVTITGSQFDQGDNTVAAFDFTMFLGEEERCNLGERRVSWGSFSCEVTSGVFPGSVPISIQMGTSGYAAGTKNLNLVVVPTITGVAPLEGSLGGNTLVSIFGSGFSRMAADNFVTLWARPCAVTRATENMLECRTTTASSATNPLGARIPTIGKVQYDTFQSDTRHATIERVTGRLNYLNPDYTSWTTAFGSRGSTIRDNQLAQWTTYFTPIATGGYKFRVRGDDIVELWLSINEDPAPYVDQYPNDNDLPYNERRVAFTEGYNTVWQESATITLESGRRYWMRLMNLNGGGGMWAEAEYAFGSGNYSMFHSSVVAFIEPYSAPVKVVARGIEAAHGENCKSFGSCYFSYATASTPRVTTAVSTGSSVTLNGYNFGLETSQVSVSVGEASCQIVSVTDTVLTCLISSSASIGTGELKLHRFGKGDAVIAGSIKISVTSMINSVNQDGGALTIHGSFLPSRSAIQHGSLSCSDVRGGGTQLFCNSLVTVSGATSLTITAPNIIQSTATNSFVYKQQNDRPGTTQPMASPTFTPTSGSPNGGYFLLIVVPPWTLNRLQDVQVQLGTDQCIVFAALGSQIRCSVPVAVVEGTVDVVVTHVPTNQVFNIGQFNYVPTVVQLYPSRQGPDGGNVVFVTVEHTRPQDITVSVRGLPCVALRDEQTQYRCDISDLAKTSTPYLPVLDSYPAGDVNSLTNFVISANVQATAAGFRIPAGGFLFTRKNYNGNIVVKARITPTDNVKCIGLMVLSPDPSSTRYGIRAYSQATTYGVAVNGWFPVGESQYTQNSNTQIRISEAQDWKVEVSMSHAQFYVGDVLVGTLEMNNRGKSGMVGISPCQEVLVDNLVIEDFYPKSLQLNVSGRAISGGDIFYGAITNFQVTSSSPNVVLGGQNLTLTGTFATYGRVHVNMFVFPTNDHQLDFQTPPLCSPLTMPSLPNGTAQCNINGEIRAGLYTARFRVLEGFLANRIAITIRASVTAVTPERGSIRGVILTVKGASFSTATAITVGGQSCTILLNSPSQLLCRVPAPISESSLGPHVILVTDLSGSVSMCPSCTSFTYGGDVPNITQVPVEHSTINNYGEVVLRGSNFDNVGTIYFGNTPCEITWSTSTVVACRIKAELTQSGALPITAYFRSSGWAETNGLTINSAQRFRLRGSTRGGTVGNRNIEVDGSLFNLGSFVVADSFDFNSAAVIPAGWSVTGGFRKLSVCGGMGTMIGGVENFFHGTRMSTSITGLTAHQYVQITFQAAAIDGWWHDTEKFLVVVDDMEYTFDLSVYGECNFAGAPVSTCGNEWTDCRVRRSFVVPHTSSTLSLTFTTTIKFNSGSRAWGMTSYSVGIASSIPTAVTVGGSACGIQYMDRGRISCTTGGAANGTVAAVTVNDGSSVVPCSAEPCSYTYLDSAAPTPRTLTFSNIARLFNQSSVMWGDRVRTTVDEDGALRKNVLSNDWNGGATSHQRFFKSEGFRGVTFNFGRGSQHFMFGLATSQNNNAHYHDIDFGMYTTDNYLYCYENGAYKIARHTGATFSDTEYSIRIDANDKVTFYGDGMLIYRSRNLAKWPLRLDTSIYSSTAQVTNIRLHFASSSVSLLAPLVVAGDNIWDDGSTKVFINNAECQLIHVTKGHATCAVIASNFELGNLYNIMVTGSSGSLPMVTTLMLKPAVTSISANFGSIHGSHRITIKGSGFVSTPMVTIGSGICSILNFAFDTIVCNSPAPGAVALDEAVSVSVNAIQATCVSHVATESVNAVSFLCPKYSFNTSIPASAATFDSVTRTVTLTGTFLQQPPSRVSIGGLACVVTSASLTQIVCDVPSMAMAGSYSAAAVYDSLGISEAQIVFIPFSVSSFSPSLVGNSGGARVTVSGFNFGTNWAPSLSLTTVTGSVNICSSILERRGTSFVCLTSAGDFSGSVSLSSSSAPGSPALVVTTAAFSTNPAAAPTLYSLFPTSISVGEVITLEGARFTPDAVVEIGTRVCPTVGTVSSSRITCLVGDALPAPVTLRVVQSSVGSTNNALTVSPAFKVHGVTPLAAQPGSTITIHGSGFTDVTISHYNVSVGGVPCLVSSIPAAGTLLCTLGTPSSYFGVLVDVVVTHNSGTLLTTTFNFNYNAPIVPIVTSVTPTSGSKAGGTEITISGSGFHVDIRKVRVTLNGLNCQIVFNTAATIRCLVPPIPTRGPNSAEVVLTSDGITANDHPLFMFDFRILTITSNGNPITSVSAEGGIRITVVGTGFPWKITNALIVKIGNEVCAVSSTVSSSIECLLPPSPRTRLVSITLASSYPMRPSNSSVITVEVNGTVATGPSITYLSAGLTPTITAVQAAATIHHGDPITITGTSFAASGNVVTLHLIGVRGSPSTCTVTTESSTSITCSASLATFGRHFIRVFVPSVGIAYSQRSCNSGEFLMCDGTCVAPGSCSYASWGVRTCQELANGVAHDKFCQSLGGSDRVNLPLLTDVGTPFNVNCPMYSCEASDCSQSLFIGGKGGIVTTCGEDPNGFVITAKIQISSIVGPSESSVKGGLRLTITGSNLNTDVAIRFLFQGAVIAGCTPLPGATASSLVCETLPVSAPTAALDVAVYGGKQIATCSTCSGRVSYTSVATPTVSFVAPISSSRIDAEYGFPVTFRGTGFSIVSSENIVTIGGLPCTVLSSNETQIMCLPPALNYTSYPWSIRIESKGLISTTIATQAHGFVRMKTLDVLSQTSTAGGKTLVASGSGFGQWPTSTVEIENCPSPNVLSINATHAVFVTAPCTGSRRVYVVNSGSRSSCRTSCNAIFNSVATPVATVTTVDTTTLQITSTLLPATQDTVSVTVGHSACVISTFSPTALTCTLPADHVGGQFDVNLVVGQYGRASQSSMTSVNFSWAATAVSPSSGSIGGNQLITISGSGFGSNANVVRVTVAAVPCSLVSVGPTSIVCRTPSTTSSGSVLVTVFSDQPPLSRLSSSFLSALSFNYDSALTARVSSVEPSQGSTAGGTRLTIRGLNLHTTATMTIMGNLCTQSTDEQVLTSASAGAVLYCTTTASSTSDRAVPVAVATPTGEAVVNKGATYQYIDLWSRWTTWGNNPPPQLGDSAVISEGQTIMLDYSPPKLFLIIVMGHMIFDDTKNITLEVTYIMINFGRLTIGTPQNPFTKKATIRLYGDRLTPEIPVHGSKVLALRHGALDMHGVVRTPTWTKLAASAAAGSPTITVRGVVDWVINEEIVITPTDFDMEHSEPRFITSVSTSGGDTILGLSTPLNFFHNGAVQCFPGSICIEEVAEVMMLTRNIVVEGDKNSQRLGFGATLFLMPLGQSVDRFARLSYVEFRDVGQQYIVGRYPVHFHVTGSSNTSYVNGTSVHRSLNRAFSIHGISNNTYVNNVVYDTHGHAFFIEDGSEKWNVIKNNLVAVARSSTSNLNTDITPACFWIVSPQNHIEGNHAAGAAAYGFWISPFHPHSTGPTHSTSICPSTHKMWYFSNNTAHSNMKYGLNVFQFWWPKSRECDLNSEDEQAVVRNHFSFKNRIHGVSVAHSEVGEVGSVKFDNLVSADNGEHHEDAAAFWVEHIKAKNMSFGLQNSVLIARSNNDPMVRTTARRGINLPLGDNFFSENVTFINYNAENFGFEPQAWAHRRSFCFPWGWEAVSRGLRWINSPNRIRFRFHHHGLLNDDDGTLTGTPRSQILPSTPLMSPSFCTPATGFQTLTPSIVCTSNYKLRRFGVSNVNEVFTDQIWTVDNRSEVVIEIKRKYSMIAPMNREVSIDFNHSFTPERWDWKVNPRFMAPNEKILFTTKYKEARRYVNGTFSPPIGNAEKTVPVQLTDTTSGWHFNQDTRVFSALLVPPQLNIAVLAQNCPWDGCPLPPPSPPALDVPCKPFDNPSSWNSRQVPAPGSDVIIRFNESICLNSGSLRFGSLTLEGKLELRNDHCTSSSTKFTVVVEKFFLLRQGIFVVGNDTNRFTACKFEFIIGPVNFNNVPAHTMPPWSMRGFNVEAGRLSLFGALPNAVYTRLAETVAAGATSITVASVVNWKAGDRIAIAATRREQIFTSGALRGEESEHAEILSLTGNVVQLKSALKHYHRGGPAVTLNGRSVAVGAEVALLTRNILLSGGHTDAETIPFGTGWNLNIGCTAELHTGCSVGTNDKMGWPMSAAKLGSVQMDSIEMKDVGQHGSRFAAIEVDGLVTSTSGTSYGSFMRNSAVWRVHNAGVAIRHTSRSFELSNNVLYLVNGDGFRIAGTGNTLDGNLVIANLVPLPECDTVYFFNTGQTCISSSFRITSGNALRNNIAASGVGAGYLTEGEPCSLFSAILWENNVVHSHRDGLLISDKAGDDDLFFWQYRTHHTCRRVGGVTAIGNGDNGVIAWYVSGDLFISNVHTVDNTIGLSVMLFDEGIDVGERQLELNVRDSSFAGRFTGQACTAEHHFVCRHTLLDSSPWCKTFYEGGSTRFGNIGIVETVFVQSSFSGRTKGEHKFMWMEPDSYTTIKGRATFENIKFDNFPGVNTCGNREHAFMNNMFSNDTFHHHVFQQITWGSGVPVGSELYSHKMYGDVRGHSTLGVQSVFLDFDNHKFGAYWPDAPNKFWLVDLDGSFTRTGSMTTVLSSETLVRSTTFDSILWDGMSLRNIAALPGTIRAGCSKVDAWNAYQCDNRYKFVSLSMENKAEDALTRRAAPIVLCKGDGMVGANGFPICPGGAIDFASGPVMKGKVQRATLERLSRFRFIAEIGANYTLYFRGQPPTWTRFWLHDHEYSGLSTSSIGVVINIRYFGLNAKSRVGVYVNRVRQTSSIGNGYPWTMSPPQNWPQALDPQGTHFHNKGISNGIENNVMSVTVRPGSALDLKQEDIVIVTMTVSMSVTDFFAQRDTFAAAMAAVLGIPAHRLRFAEIVAGSSSRMLLQSTASTRITVEVEQDAATLSSNNEAAFNTAAQGSTYVAPSSGLSTISSQLGSFTTMIGSFAVSGVSSHVAEVTTIMPSISIGSAFNYIEVNVTSAWSFNRSQVVDSILSYTNRVITNMYPSKVRNATLDEVGVTNVFQFDSNRTRFTISFAFEGNDAMSNWAVHYLHDALVLNAAGVLPAALVVTGRRYSQTAALIEPPSNSRTTARAPLTSSEVLAVVIVVAGVVLVALVVVVVITIHVCSKKEGTEKKCPKER